MTLPVLLGLLLGGAWVRTVPGGAAYFLAFGVMIVLGVWRPPRLLRAWRRLGAPHLLFCAAVVLAVVHGLLVNPLVPVLADLAFLLPLVLLPVAAAWLHAGRAARKPVLLLEWLGIWIAVVVIVRALGGVAIGGAVPRAELVRGVPDLYLLVGGSISLARWDFDLGLSTLQRNTRLIWAMACLVALAILSYRLHTVLLVGLFAWRIGRRLLSFRRSSARIAAGAALTIVIVGAVAAIMAGPALAPYLDRAATRVLVGDASTDEARVLETLAVWNEVRGSGATAVGRGMGVEYEYLRWEGGRFRSWRGRYTHNVLTYWFLVAGIIGVVGVAALWWRLAALGLSLRLHADPHAATTGHALVVVLGFSLLFSGNSTLYVPTTVMILAAAAVSFEVRARRRPPDLTPNLPATPAAAEPR